MGRDRPASRQAEKHRSVSLLTFSVGAVLRMNEYMTIHEAIAWIATCDEAFAEKMRDVEPVRFAVAMAIKRADGPLPRSLDRSSRLLLDRCGAGRVLAKGFLGGAGTVRSIRRERIEPSDWIGLDLFDGVAKPKRGDGPYFYEPVFLRKDVKREFPPTEWEPPRPAREAKSQPQKLEGAPDTRIVFGRVADPMPNCAEGGSSRPDATTAATSESQPVKSAVPPANKRGAPSLVDKDRPYVEMIQRLRSQDNISAKAAAERIFDQNKTSLAGIGNEDSIIKRLSRRALKESIHGSE